MNTDRAIVTEIEGTTRDTIEEYIQIDGIPIKIIDTAGIRNTDNPIEQIGINKSIEEAKSADLIIAIIDSSKKLEEEDIQILEMIKDRKAIILLNKIDKGESVNENDIKKYVSDKTILSISALNKTGIEAVYSEISKLYNFGSIEIDDSLTITNERHKQAIIKMKEHIKKAKEGINKQMPIDVITINITNILEEIGEITGESVSEDIINGIFKKFCLGK